MKEIEIIEQHIKSQKFRGRLLHNRRFRLTDTDVKLIRKQLKRFTLEDLLDAITQLHRTEWNLGDNPDGRKHLRLGLAIDDDHIQKRLDAFEEYEARLERLADEAALRQEEDEREEYTPPSEIVDSKAAYRNARRGQ